MNSKLFYALVVSLLLGNLTYFQAQNSTNTSKEIKELISKKREFNKKYGYGYRVQIYYGEETKAKSLQSKFRVTFPEVETFLNYEQPYWKVQVGNYKTTLEADKALLKFSEKFSGLIVIPLGK